MQSRRNNIPEASVITDFAITTINVPDRLDAQEVRARAEAEDAPAERRARGAGNLVRWLVGISAAIAIVIAALAAFEALSPAWSGISAAGISSRLSQALGRPVQVESAGIRLAPTPRLMIEGIEVVDQFRIQSVALRFGWASFAKIFQGTGWVWGEATVGPLELSAHDALALIQALPALSTAVPAPITSIKFESVRFRGTDLLPARYQILAARPAGNTFSQLSVTEIDSAGRMDLGVSLAVTQPARFRLRAFNWRPPMGPAYEWTEVSAEGTFAPGGLQVDSYSANAFLGVVSGNLVAAKSAQWVVRGTVQLANIDLAAVLREARKRAKTPLDNKNAPVIQGLIDGSATLAGQGGTLSEALERTTAMGRVRLKFATLNGANLGAGAVQAGGARGGVTRFGDLEATATVTPGMVRVKDIVGNAGALQVKGALGIERNYALGGVLRAEVASAGGTALADVRLSGTVFEPVFEY